MRRQGYHTAVVSCLLLAAAAHAPAGPIDYGDFLGLAPGQVDFLSVTENSTTGVPPLFGPPTRVANSLLFAPDSFLSSSQDGLAGTTSAILQMTIVADVGHFLEKITVWESGGYTLTGIGTIATSSRINGDMFLAGLGSGGPVTLSDPLTVLPQSVFALPDDDNGTFAAKSVVDFSGLQVAQATFTFNNNLQTASELGTRAMIEKTTVRIDVPEPASLWLLSMALWFHVKRRRR